MAVGAVASAWREQDAWRGRSNIGRARSLRNGAHLDHRLGTHEYCTSSIASMNQIIKICLSCAQAYFPSAKLAFTRITRLSSHSPFVRDTHDYFRSECFYLSQAFVYLSSPIAVRRRSHLPLRQGVPRNEERPDRSLPDVACSIIPTQIDFERSDTPWNTT